MPRALDLRISAGSSAYENPVTLMEEIRERSKSIMDLGDIYLWTCRTIHPGRPVECILVVRHLISSEANPCDKFLAGPDRKGSLLFENAYLRKYSPPELVLDPAPAQKSGTQADR